MILYLLAEYEFTPVDTSRLMCLLRWLVHRPMVSFRLLGHCVCVALSFSKPVDTGKKVPQ